VTTLLDSTSQSSSAASGLYKGRALQVAMGASERATVDPEVGALRRVEEVPPAAVRGRAARPDPVGRARRLDVIDVLIGESRDHFGQHFADMASGDAAEPGERRKEMVMSGFGDPVKLTHRHRVEHRRVKIRVGECSRDRYEAIVRRLRTRNDGELRRIDAHGIPPRQVEIRLRVDRAGKMIVQITALRHRVQKLAK